MSDFSESTIDASEPQSVSEVSLDGIDFGAPEGDNTTPEFEAPAFEAADPEAPEAPAVEADPAADDPYSEFGGREAVQAAVKLYETAASEEGIIQIWIEAGRSLGLTVEQMQRLFDDGGAPDAGSEVPEFDPEEPMTRAEFLEWQRQQQEAYQRQAWEQQQLQTRAAASQALHAEVENLGLKMDDPAVKHILALGDRYLDRQNLSPEGVREAVRRGHAEYQAEVQRAAQAYIQQKKSTKVPGAPSGASAPSAPSPNEPKDTAEAIRMFRERFGS